MAIDASLAPPNHLSVVGFDDILPGVTLTLVTLVARASTVAPKVH